MGDNTERMTQRLAQCDHAARLSPLSLLKSTISDELRLDEAKLAHGQTARLIEALKKRDVSDEVLNTAAHDTNAD